MVKSMRKVSDPRRARQIISILRHRIGDIQHVGWPALEQSLKDDLDRVEAVARERGLIK